MTTPKIIAPKKLIEVALPLEDINKEAAKSKRKSPAGYPTTLHCWFAQRPVSAARAVIFAQLVNDPSWKFTEDEIKKPQVRSAITRKRNELFKLITELVRWENVSNRDLLERASAEIRTSWRETCHANRHHPDAHTLFNPDRLPPLTDPFAGGGSIPLEAQRLGLEARATDLNPVAVLINKALIEVPIRFRGSPPVGPIPPGRKQTTSASTEEWSGARGLAEDVRRYGAWMRGEAEKRLGQYYPGISVGADAVGKRPDLAPYKNQTLPVIAYLWARTVFSPSPAFADCRVPLATTFMLSTKKGKEAWLRPTVKGRGYAFEVCTGPAPEGAQEGTKVARGAHFKCLLSGAAITPDHIHAEARAGRMGARLMAVVVDGERGRMYLSPTDEQERVALVAPPALQRRLDMPANPRWFSPPLYGLPAYEDLFTARQLVALLTLCELVREVRERVRVDAVAAHGAGAPRTHASEYADAVCLYLAFAVDRLADYGSTIATWRPKDNAMRSALSKQAVPMTWDYAEGSPFGDSSSGFLKCLDVVARVLDFIPQHGDGVAKQADAQTNSDCVNTFVSTDPPYYDNIGYADLSDFFYVWLRRSLADSYPALFATLAVPKAEELVATPYRHGGKEQAELFFLTGMTTALRRIAENAHPAAPVTIYYAFKQSETDGEETSSTGWETFLEAVLQAGLVVTGTWPVRTEGDNRQVGNQANALASSIVLVCRRRDAVASTVSRRDFLREIGRAMPLAISEMTADPAALIAPVDLAQACIGPGMALFSRYHAVLEADGSSMSVRNAIVHINKAIDDHFAHAEGELDDDTRFCVGWFEQFGFEAGDFGQADVLARAKGTSVEGVKEAGVIQAGKGKVRLFAIKELPKKWDPTTDARTPIWEALHHMCRALGESEGDAGALLAKMPEKQDAIRQLAYRLYTLCAERKGKAELGRPYNDLITSWPAIVEASTKVGHTRTQLDLL